MQLVSGPGPQEARSLRKQPLSSFEALTGTVSAADAFQALGGLRWHPDYRAEIITPTRCGSTRFR